MLKILATATLVATTAGMALAQYQGPSSGGQPAAGYATTTVGAVKAEPRDDARVILEGRLINKTGDETYVFSDDTGQIMVDIDDEDFPAQAVTETTVLRIEGEVDTHLNKDVDIDADRISIVR